MTRAARISSLGGNIEVSHATYAGRGRRVNLDAYLVFPLVPHQRDRSQSAASSCVALVADCAARNDDVAESGQKQPTTSATAVDKMYALISAMSLSDLEMGLAGAIRRTRIAVDVGPTPVTILAAALYQGKLLLAYAGNNRAYLIRNRAVRQLTLGDTRLAARARSIEAGSAGDADKNVYNLHRMIPTVMERSVGAPHYDGEVHHLIFDVNQPNTETFYPKSGALVDRLTLEPGDLILLCTNGLTDVLFDADLQAVAAQYPATEVAEHLIALAIERGTPDSATVVALGWRGSPRSQTGRSLRGTPLHRTTLALMVTIIMVFLVGLGGQMGKLFAKPTWLWQVENSHAQVDPAQESSAFSTPTTAPTQPAPSEDKTPSTASRSTAMPYAVLASQSVSAAVESGAAVFDTSILTATARPTAMPLVPLPTIQAILVFSQPISATVAVVATNTVPTNPDLRQPLTAADVEFYAIRKGDNLWDLAWELGTTVDALLRMNPSITKETVLSVDQEILIPKRVITSTHSTP